MLIATRRISGVAAVSGFVDDWSAADHGESWGDMVAKLETLQCFQWEVSLDTMLYLIDQSTLLRKWVAIQRKNCFTLMMISGFGVWTCS